MGMGRETLPDLDKLIAENIIEDVLDRAINENIWGKKVAGWKKHKCQSES